MAIWDIKERNNIVRANEFRGDRGVFGGGHSAQNVIQFIEINKPGDATDFGDLLEVGSNYAGFSGD